MLFDGAGLSFTVAICRSVIPVIFLLVFHSVSCKQSDGNRKHKRKNLRFPSPAFAMQKQCFISMVEVMVTQKEASPVHQMGPSEAEACSGSSIQISEEHQQQPQTSWTSLRVCRHLLSSLCPSPMGRIVSIKALFAGQYAFSPNVMIQLDRVL